MLSPANRGGNRGQQGNNMKQGTHAGLASYFSAL